MANLAALSPPTEFTAAEERVVVAILDAMFADIGEEEAKELAAEARRAGSEAPAAALEAFARRKATESAPDAMALVRRRIGAAPPHDVAAFHLLVTALASRAGCLALTGRRGPLDRLGAREVQHVVRGWMASPIVNVREIGKVFKLLVAAVCLGAATGEENPNWRAIGYAAPDAAKLRAAVEGAGAVDFRRLRVHPGVLEGPARQLLVDCVVVGSGPGGAVAAAELTEAGYRVALIESGRWAPSGEQQISELDSNRNQYQEGGQLFTTDRNLTILAGATFGGGASLNWSCCLPPPDQVRQEWARDFGVDWAAGPAMAEAVERVRERLSMHTEGVVLNQANQVLVRGCQRLGYQVEVAAQQGYEPNAPDDGGWCSMGWKHGPRQGMHGSALLDAAKTGRLVILDGCTAHEVLRDRSGAACAVRATVAGEGGSVDLVVRGRAVVVAGGALQTPLLLRRSGLKNRHIGRNLRLHPAMTVWGRFDEPVRFFQGAPMTTVSRVAEDQDGRGYGAKIWLPNFHPVTWAAWLPWQGAREFKQALAGYGHAAPLISLVRDQSGGKVWEDGQGRLRVAYRMSRVDRGHLQTAAEHAYRILAAAGARELHSVHNTVAPLKLGSSSKEAHDGKVPEVEAWLGGLRRAGMPRLAVALGSAHQMGTCRMAASPHLGAAKPTGETWEVPGLFVADTSTFPTASGVNPMWTCAAVAHHVAQQVKLHLQTAAPPGEPCPTRRASSCMSAGGAGVPEGRGDESDGEDAASTSDAEGSVN